MLHHSQVALNFILITDDPLDKKVSHIQHFWALGGFVLAVVAFCGYLVLMAKQGNEEEKQYLVDKVILHELENSDAYDLKGLVGPIIAEGKKKLLSARASGLAATLLDEDKKRLGQLINPFFKRYDIQKKYTSEKMQKKFLCRFRRF